MAGVVGRRFFPRSGKRSAPGAHLHYLMLNVLTDTICCGGCLVFYLLLWLTNGVARAVFVRVPPIG